VENPEDRLAVGVSRHALVPERSIGGQSCPPVAPRPSRNRGLLLLALGTLPRLARATDPAEAPAEPTVEVRGSRPHPSALPKEPTVSGSHLDRDALAPAGVTLPDALRTVPGLTVTQLGGLGAPATARIRGASAAQTAVYLGSIRLNDEVGGVADLSTIPSSLIGTIDVYRSLTPRFIGLEGMGGTILLTPRMPWGAEASSKLTFGSFTSERLELSLGGCHRQTSCLLGGLELARAENDYPFHDSRGILLVDEEGEVVRLPNADSTQGSGFLTGKTRLGSTDILLFAEQTSREQGAPKLALVPSRQARARFGRSALGLEVKTPLDSWRGDMTFTSSVVLAGTDLDDPLLEMGLGTTGVSTPGRRFEQAARFSQSPTGWFSLEQHVAIAYEGIDRLEEVEGRTDVALAASRLGTRLALGADVTPALGIDGSARVSLACIDTSEGSLDFCSQVVPGARGGVGWKKGALATYLNVALAARPPTLSELYGVSLVMRGNEDLAPESASTLEAGLRHHLPRTGEPRLWFDVSAFARFAQDLIVFTRTAQGFLRPENRDQTRTLGGEVSLGTMPLRGLYLLGNASLLDPRDTTPERTVANDILPFSSRFVTSVSVEQRVAVRSDSLQSLRFSLKGHYESSRYADAAGLAVIPEQSFVDLELGSGWFPSVSPPQESRADAQRPLLSFDVRISNLFDQPRYDIVGFPLPGRAWFASLALELR